MMKVTKHESFGSSYELFYFFAHEVQFVFQVLFATKRGQKWGEFYWRLAVPSLFSLKKNGYYGVDGRKVPVENKIK